MYIRTYMYIAYCKDILHIHMLCMTKYIVYVNKVYFSYKYVRMYIQYWMFRLVTSVGLALSQSLKC